MAYVSIKKINGRCYLYQQVSYREKPSGQVKSPSVYIGPVEEAVAQRMLDTRAKVAGAFGLSSDAAESPPEGRVDTGTDPEPPTPTKPSEPLTITRKGITFKVDPNTGEILEGDVEKLFNLTKRNVDSRAKPTPPSTLKIRAKFTKNRISETALQKEHERFTGHMAKLGIDPATAPKLRIGNGSKVAMKRSRWSGDYILTVPNRSTRDGSLAKAMMKVDRRTKAGRRTPRDDRDPSRGVSADFRQAYRRALSASLLDAMAQQQPDRYEALRLRLDQDYSTTRWAMIHYILSTNSRAKFGLTLHFWLSGRLSGWYRRNLPAEMFGLVDHSPRHNWRADTEALMAECLKRGWAETASRAHASLKKARAAEKAAMNAYLKLGRLDGLSGKKSRQRKTINRAVARCHALQATLRKLDAIRPIIRMANR